MPKIPTFTSQGRPTAETTGVRSNISISPTSTVAARLLPAANELSNYAIKKRDNTEKLEANKTLLELKAEQEKIIFSQKKGSICEFFQVMKLERSRNDRILTA